MSKIKGQNFRLLVGDKSSIDAVPEAVNCSVTLTGNTEDNSTKDTEGMFTQEQVVSTSWQGTVETYQSTPEQIKNLLAMFIAAQAVKVGWDQTATTAGSQNRTPVNANFHRSGNALLTDLTFQFNDRTTVQTNLQFQGTGALS